MTQLWVNKPYVFGAWFTYAFHTGASIDPAAGIVTTDGKMCATLAGTSVDAGGGAIGFQVCGSPLYPNLEGESAWFPLACGGDLPADKCVPSETAMPYSFCGGSLAGVKFEGFGVEKIEFKGPNDSNLEGGATHTEVVPTDGFAAIPAGYGGDVTAIHFKSFSDGELCLTRVELVYE